MNRTISDKNVGQ